MEKHILIKNKLVMLFDYHTFFQWFFLPEPHLLVVMATIAGNAGRQDGISRRKVDHWATIEQQDAISLCLNVLG